MLCNFASSRLLWRWKQYVTRNVGKTSIRMSRVSQPKIPLYSVNCIVQADPDKTGLACKNLELYDSLYIN
jgi:hypothetical protein